MNLCYHVFDKFSGKIEEQIKSLLLLLKNRGSDYSKYTDDEKKILFKTVKYAQVLKMIIDLPLLNEDGELIEQSILKIRNIECLTNPETLFLFRKV